VGALLFNYRYNIEKELVRLSVAKLGYQNRKGIMHSLAELVTDEIITIEQLSAIRNIYSIASLAIHTEENKLTKGQIDFCKKISPGLIEELRLIK